MVKHFAQLFQLVSMSHLSALDLNQRLCGALDHVAGQVGCPVEAFSGFQHHRIKEVLPGCLGVVVCQGANSTS